MACYIGFSRRGTKVYNIISSGGGGVSSVSSSSPLISLFFSSCSRRMQTNRRTCHLVRYKSTTTTAAKADASRSKGKFYTFLTKPRSGIGSFSAVCGHCSSICTVMAYGSTEMLPLRSLAISSSLLSIIFQYYRPQPLWIPIRWGFVILGINGYMITQLLIERHKANHLSPQLQKIYDEGGFDERGFSKIQFMKFFEQSRRVVFTNNELISQEGREMNKLYYILDGEAIVKCKKDGRRLATISPHCFIGELSFLRFVQDIKKHKGDIKSEPNKLASANVYANKTVHMQVWDFRELCKVLANDRDLSNAFASYCSHDLRDKLLSANAEGYVESALT